MKQFAIEDIKKDEVVQEYFLAKNIRQSTKKLYTRRLRYYCNFVGKTPTELIEEAENEEEQGLRMRKRSIKKYFLSWLKELQQKDYSESSISTLFTSIKVFYRFFEIDIPKVMINSTGNNNKSNEKIPTKEDIKKALPYANMKYKAIILLMASSGMGSAEIRNLTYEDFLEAIKEYFKPSKNEQFDMDLITERLEKSRNIIPTWRIKRYKTGMPYITFSTPESMEALILYMNKRTKDGYPFKSLKDYIFLSNGKKITDSVLAIYFNRLNNAIGFGKVGHYAFFHSHALRKFFGSTLNNKGIQRINYDFMMGHQVDKIADAYIKPNAETLKREYMKCLDNLSIESVEIRRIESEEVKNIVNELNEKDKQLKELEKRLDAVKGLEKRLKILEESEKRSAEFTKETFEGKFQNKFEVKKKDGKQYLQHKKGI